MITKNTYEYNTEVEFEDIDSYGIAHHSKLINYLERARVHFFRDEGLSVNDGELCLVLVSMNIKFIKPVKMLDSITVHLQVQSLKSASIIWKYTITSGDKKILEADVKQASVDKSTLRPCRFKDIYQKSLFKIAIPET